MALVLWLLCPLVDLILNTSTLYKDKNKSDVYLITTHAHNFNQHRLLVFSPRSAVKYGPENKCHGFLYSEIFGLCAAFNKYFVAVELTGITIYFS